MAGDVGDEKKEEKTKQITESHGKVFIYEIEMGSGHIVKCRNVTELTILIKKKRRETRACVCATTGTVCVPIWLLVLFSIISHFVAFLFWILWRVLVAHCASVLNTPENGPLTRPYAPNAQRSLMWRHQEMIHLMSIIRSRFKFPSRPCIRTYHGVSHSLIEAHDWNWTKKKMWNFSFYENAVKNVDKILSDGAYSLNCKGD